MTVAEAVKLFGVTRPQVDVAVGNRELPYFLLPQPKGKGERVHIVAHALFLWIQDKGRVVKPSRNMLRPKVVNE